MVDISRKTRVLEGVAPDAIPFADLLRKETPTILKGVVRDWPLVQAGQESQPQRWPT